MVLEFAKGTENTFQFRRDGGSQFYYGFFACGSTFLRQETNPGAPFQFDFSSVRFSVTKDDGEERGFAGSVGTHETDSIPA